MSKQPWSEAAILLEFFGSGESKLIRDGAGSCEFGIWRHYIAIGLFEV